jgi:hypothetical protein
MIEDELGGIEEAPEDVLVRLAVLGVAADEFEEGFEFFGLGFAAEGAEVEVFDDRFGRRAGLELLFDDLAETDLALHGVTGDHVKGLREGGLELGVAGADAGASGAAEGFEEGIAGHRVRGVAGGAGIVLDGFGAFGEIGEAAFAIGGFDNGIEQDIGAETAELGAGELAGVVRVGLVGLR